MGDGGWGVGEWGVGVGGGHPSESVFGHLEVYMMISLTLDLLNLNSLPHIMGVVWKLT